MSYMGYQKMDYRLGIALANKCIIKKAEHTVKCDRRVFVEFMLSG